MPSEWPLVRLADVASFQEGYVNPSQSEQSYFGNDYKWLRATDLNNGFVYETGRRLSKKGFQSAGKSAVLFEPGTLAISKSGTIGRLGILRDYMCGNRAVINIRPNSRVDTRFLFYSLLNQRPTIETLAEGSVQRNLYVSQLGRVEVALPTPAVQQNIGEVLGCLDNRIDLMRQTNTTLESIAQALFKSWFVDFDPVRARQAGREPEGMDAATAALFPAEFDESVLGLIPKGWRVGTFGGLATLAKGTLNPLNSPSAVFEHYSLPAFDAGQLPVFETGDSIKSNKTGVPPRAVLQSKLNPHIPRVWFPSRVGEQAVCSTEFLPWLAKDTASPEVVYCVLTSTSFESEVRTLVTGTSNSHQRVKPDLVAGLGLVTAPAEVYRAFTNVVRPALQKVGENRWSAKNLAELRDTLLPRLISGKLRLPEAQEQLEDALA